MNLLKAAIVAARLLGEVSSSRLKSSISVARLLASASTSRLKSAVITSRLLAEIVIGRFMEFLTPSDQVAASDEDAKAVGKSLIDLSLIHI